MEEKKWYELPRRVTLISSLGNVHNVGNVWCQLGKEWDGNGCTHPATDVTHQHRVLVAKTHEKKNTKMILALVYAKRFVHQTHIHLAYWNVNLLAH